MDKKKQRNQITNELVNSILPAVQKMLLAIKNDSSKLIEPKHTFVPSNSFLCHTFFFCLFSTALALLLILCSLCALPPSKRFARYVLVLLYESSAHTHTQNYSKNTKKACWLITITLWAAYQNETVCVDLWLHVLHVVITTRILFINVNSNN